jgi:hypothetical protein
VPSFVRVSIPQEAGRWWLTAPDSHAFYCPDYRHARAEPLSPVVTTDAGYTTRSLREGDVAASAGNTGSTMLPMAGGDAF